MKQLMLMSLLGLIALGLAATPLQANFVQCPSAGGVCGVTQGTTDNADVVNGSPLNDTIDSGAGDDVVLGNAGNDFILANRGNDLVSGGLGDDDISGVDGDDILLPGPDDPLGLGQIADGWLGNDTTNVFVGEITTCLIIEDNGGTDVANLIGFGPYSAQKPFGQPGFGNDMFVIVNDPITDGVIAIEVSEDNDTGIETINGLLSPTVTIGDLPFECDGLLG